MTTKKDQYKSLRPPEAAKLAQPKNAYILLITLYILYGWLFSNEEK
jgi:hypothetical protein